jgi:hypothetical protein
MRKVNGRPALPPTPLRKLDIQPGPGTKEKFLNIGAAGPLQPAPFLDGDQNGGFYTATRYYLRTLGKGCIKEFAESGLRFL